MSYPDISAVILDASFDDLVPLALKVMPDSWRECSSPRPVLSWEGGSTGLCGWRSGLPARWVAGPSPVHPLWVVPTLGGLVTRTVRQHLNLNNSEQLCR